MQPIVITWRTVLANRHVHLLLIILITFVALPLAGHREEASGTSFFGFLAMIAILLSLRAIMGESHRVWLYVGAVILVFLADMASVSLKENAAYVHLGLRVLALGTFAACLLLSIWGMLVQLFRSRTVTMDSILGGVALYFLLGYFWAVVFGMVITVNPDAFSSASHIDLFYFSFTTLTTLGYGDLVPKTDYATVLANLEAVVGQMYVAIFIARLVSLHIVTEANQHVE